MSKNKSKQSKVSVVTNGLNEVIQPTYNQNNRAISFEEIVSGADYGLLSTKPNVLANTYKNNSFAQIAIDLPVQDAFRDGGYTLDSQTLGADELLELTDFMDDQGDKNTLKDVCRWGGLFGGGALVLDYGKHHDTPINIESLYKKDVGFLATDRWQCVPMDASIFSAEKFTLQDLNSKNAKDYLTIHKSRLKLFIPKIEPYYIRNQLQGWGASKFEAIIPSLAQYIKANSVILELLDEAKIDILKIFGLSDVLMSAEGEAAVKKRLRIFAEQKNFQSVGAMDVKDDYVQKQLSFGSLDQMIEKIMLLICSALRIPYSKVFGKGASGFSSGEDDLENYNGMVMSTIREPITPLLKWMLDIRCIQLFGRKIDDLVITWKPLRVLNEVDQQNVRTQKINSYIQLCQLGVMTKKQVAEQLTTDKIVLFKPEEIEAIDDTLNPDEMENVVQVEDVQNSRDKKKRFWDFFIKNNNPYKDEKGRFAPSPYKKSQIQEPVYRGTRKDYDGLVERKDTDRVQGIYFSSRKDIAQTYWREGGKLLTAYLDIQNPYIDTTRRTYYDKDKDDYTDDIVRRAKQEGYDSVIFKDIEDVGSNGKYFARIKDRNYQSNDYVVFRKEQVHILEEDNQYGI